MYCCVVILSVLQLTIPKKGEDTEVLALLIHVTELCLAVCDVSAVAVLTKNAEN